MWYSVSKYLKQQTGSATSTSLMVISGVALATAGMISLNKNLRESRNQTEKSSIDRRLNESAIQAVTQLITNGMLHYNNTCGRLEPSRIAGEQEKYNGLEGQSCGNITRKNDDPRRPNAQVMLTCQEATNDTQWLYIWDSAARQAVVEVCAFATNKTPAGRTERILKKVEVRVTGYDPVNDNGETRTYALVRSKPDGRNNRGAFYNSLNARVNLGLSSGNQGLIGKHAAADTCYYMRPITKRQLRGGANNLGLAARKTTGYYTLAELEPRPDGPNKDEFQQSVDIGTSAPEGYELLTDFRDGLMKDFYKKDFRGNRPSSDSWSEDSKAWTPGQGRARYVSDVITKQDYLQRSGGQFIGVTPNIPNGPQFQYFLATVPGTSNHLHGPQWRTYQQDKVNYYRQGCATSAGDSRATFCTKVEIPLKTYRAAVNNRCRKNQRPLGAVGYKDTVRVAYADRAIQTSCNPQWIDTVERIIREEHARRVEYERKNPFDQRQNQPETTATMVVAALEADDEFIRGEGKWANRADHPLRRAYRDFSSTLAAQGNVEIVDDYTIKYIGDKDEGRDETETDKDGNVTTRYVETYKGKERRWDVYSINVLERFEVQEKNHTSRSCAYFKYYDPESPKGCRIAYTTRNEAGYVCRNNDGCFDELTKIRMADGTDRLVTQLKLGEFVFNPVTGKPAKIAKLTIGPELKPLLNVTIGSSTVRVTDTHPFMTKRGWVMANQLRTGDEILSGNKTYKAVTRVSLGETGRTVANLALEGGADQPELHYVLADGVVTGDLVIQNMLQARASADKSSGR